MTSAIEPINNAVVLDFAQGQGWPEWTPSSQDAITKGLPPPLSIDQFNDLAKQLLTNYVRARELVVLKQFFVMPFGGDGHIDIMGNLTFNHIDAHTFAGQSIVIYLFMFEASVGGPDQKTETALRLPGGDAVLAISQRAFDMFFYGQSLMKQFDKKTIADLPPPIGSNTSLEQNGVTIDSLGDRFSDGSLTLFGRFSKSVVCADGTGSFETPVTFTVDPTQTVLIPHHPPIIATVEISAEWWCTLIGVLTGGYFSGVIGAIVGGLLVDVLTTELAALVVESKSRVSVGGPTPITPVPIVPGSKLAGEMISREAFSIFQSLPPSTGIGQVKGFSIDASQELASGQEGADLTYHWDCASVSSRFSCDDCPSRDFSLNETLGSRRWTLKIIPSILARPLQVSWTVIALSTNPLRVIFTDKVPISGSQGSLTALTRSHFPLPLPNGLWLDRVSARLDYVVEHGVSDNLTLTGRPDDGNFTILVAVTVLDNVGSSFSHSILCDFRQHEIQTGIVFDNYFKQCLKNSISRTTGRVIDPETYLALVGKLDETTSWEGAAKSAVLQLAKVDPELAESYASALTLRFGNGRFALDPSSIVDAENGTLLPLTNFSSFATPEPAD